MAIENRDLPVGARLEARYKKTRHVCVVEAGEEGKRIFVLEDGRRFSSPSAAASAITGIAQNGWKWWSLEGQGATAESEAPVSAPRERKPRSTRGRGQPAAPEAIQPEEFDYEIDADGRPVDQGKGPAATGDESGAGD